MNKSLHDYALAAVISLIYVGTSVNQKPNAIMVSNHQALVAMDMDKNDWFRDSEFASIYEIAVKDTSKLSPVQLRQYSTFAANTFNAWEFAFITHNNGMMNENIWNGWDGFYRLELKQVGYLWFWNQGKEGFSPEFRSYVDSILAEA